MRAPAVAGTFYPADAAALAAGVDRLLGPAPAPDGGGSEPVALVVPHAGHRCSGPVAASAYRLVRAFQRRVRTVVVLGPAHFRDVGGMALSQCSAWSTPLGEVRVDAELGNRLLRRGLARADDGCHAGEHSIEVQLPFLQRVLGPAWSFLPVVARSVPPEAVADCLDEVASDEVPVLVSTDLSHYHERSTAEALDRRTTEAIVGRDPAAVRDQDACGAELVRGLLAWARRRNLVVEVLDRGTSADTCTGPERVVGYASFVVRRNPQRPGP